MSSLYEGNLLFISVLTDRIPIKDKGYNTREMKMLLIKGSCSLPFTRCGASLGKLVQFFFSFDKKLDFLEST